MSPRYHHLVGVWNPSYEADAMDAHVRILLDAARERREGKRTDDDVYALWLARTSYGCEISWSAWAPKASCSSWRR